MHAGDIAAAAAGAAQARSAAAALLAMPVPNDSTEDLPPPPMSESEVTDTDDDGLAPPPPTFSADGGSTDDDGYDSVEAVDLTDGSLTGLGLGAGLADSPRGRRSGATTIPQRSAVSSASIDEDEVAKDRASEPALQRQVSLALLPKPAPLQKAMSLAAIPAKATQWKPNELLKWVQSIACAPLFKGARPKSWTAQPWKSGHTLCALVCAAVGPSVLDYDALAGKSGPGAAGERIAAAMEIAEDELFVERILDVEDFGVEKVSASRLSLPLHFMRILLLTI